MSALAALALPAHAQLGPDLVVNSGETVALDPQASSLFQSITVQQGGTLTVEGSGPLMLTVADFVRIDGALVVDGVDATPVTLLNSPNIPKDGAAANAGSGAGGSGSPQTATSSAAGGNGFTSGGLTQRGGRGGESAYSPSLHDVLRLAAGGGGGRLAQDLTAQGLVATSGQPGWSTAIGALTGLSPASGGSPGLTRFTGSIDDDFFGLGLVAGRMVVGELPVPVAGQGGGAGGDSIHSSVFPPPLFSLTDNLRGGAGGSGGGLALIATGQLIVGPQGRISLDGGDGNIGEGTSGTNTIAGAGGGGSGGMLVVQADLFDLSQASIDAITALGGQGGASYDSLPSLSGGGNGGPGLIQLHPRRDPSASILLPPSRTLEDLTAPDAYVLLPFPGI
ncbi:MAG: hypothetical protein AAFZ65_16655 [Planctomycetota bacterium]